MAELAIKQNEAKLGVAPRSSKVKLGNRVASADASCLPKPEEIVYDSSVRDRQNDIDQFTSVPITYAASINSVLDNSKMSILMGFAEYVKSLVTSQGIAVTQILVTGFCDPDDGEAQVVVSVHTDELVDIAMQAWKSVDISVEEWLSKQPKLARETIFDQFTTDFTWKSAPITV